MDPVHGRQLLIASTGGHLAELIKWSSTIGASDDSLWVTARNPQSESLLADRRVLYVPYVAPRGFGAATRAFLKIARDVDWEAENFTSAVTTGAAVGLAGIAAARLHSVPAFFFESVCRVNGPSLSGRLASLDPRVHTHCQYRRWADGRWKYRGSLFDSFRRVERSSIEQPSLFVTLGTIQPYRFDALVDAVLATGLADDRTIWQLGATARHDLPGRVFTQVGSDDFDRYAREADVVVTHAGVGTALNLLEMGICPVIAPRRGARKEHVDDHQTEIAQLLRELGTAIVAEAPELDAAMIVAASGLGVAQAEAQ